MEDSHSSHRPHALWNNYRWTGTYLITIVTYARQRVLGEMQNKPEPHIELTDLGRYIEQQWLNLPDFQSQHNRRISVLGHQVMPDHFHGIIRVESEMDVTVGEIIRGFKISCTQEWRRMRQPYMADMLNPRTAGSLTNEQRDELAHMSRKQREEYYRKIGLPALFDDNYDDTVCFRDGQLENAIHYVHDNPRRAAIKRAHPDLFKLRHEEMVAGYACTILGNQFLQDYPMKEMLQCSRSLTQAEIEQKKQECLQLAERGVVYVSGAISEGEKLICRALREAGYPLIILLSEGFPAAGSQHEKYYKPQGVYFEACAKGKLLLIEPGDALFADPQIDAEVYAKTGIRDLPHTSKRYRFLAINAMIRRMCSR